MKLFPRLSEMILITAQVKKLTNKPNLKLYASLNVCRFQQPSSVLISRVAYRPRISEINSYLNSYNYLSMLPTTIFLFVISDFLQNHKCQLVTTNHPQLDNYPSMKFISFVSPSKVCSTLLSQVNSQKFMESYTPQSLLEKSLENPAQFHRLTFKTGQNYPVGITMYTLYPEYFKPNYYGNNRNACWNRLLFKSAQAYMCVFEIMATTYLGHVHNISAILLNLRNKTEVAMATTNFSGQYILNRRSSDLTADIQKKGSTQPQVLYFLYYYLEQLIYCPKFTSDISDGLSISTWIAPLSTEIWILTFVTIVFASIYQYFKYKVFGVNIVAIFLRQGQHASVFRKGKVKLILISLFGMIMCTLYENQLVSLVVSPSTPPTFKSIKSILKADYKILWSENSLSKPEVRYARDLRRRGLSLTDIVKAFHSTNYEHNPGACANAVYLSKKYTMLEANQRAKLSIKALERCMLGFGQTVRCFAVPDSISNLPYFLEMYGVARTYLLETLNGLSENGLKNQWNQWSTWNYQRFSKYHETGNVTNTSFDKINMKKLGSVHIALLCLCMVNIGVFIVELGYKNFPLKYK